MSSNTRLPGVDGLRAVAALWVVLFHMAAFSSVQFPDIPGLDLFLKSGSTGVSLFLVLSGFCLFLPFAGGRIARFKVGEFFRRRCKRLLPAYYVALLLALTLSLASADWLGQPRLTLAEGVWQIATHLTLVHTLFPDTFYSLNGAFWSLGLEWQLYLALPVLVLITRRFGLSHALAVAVAINVVYRLGLGVAVGSGYLDSQGLLAISVLPNQLPGRWAEFAFGMLAADLYASGRLERWARFVPGMLIAIVALVPLSFLAERFELSHIVYGALFFTLLSVVVTSNNPVARALAWRPLVALGTMSYSLYLVHQPVIQIAAHLLQVYRPDMSPTSVFMALLLIFPIILLLAWTLFQTVERRTMGGSSQAATSRLIPRFRIDGFSTIPTTPATPTAKAIIGRDPAAEVAERLTPS
ncbi:MAG: acyltransferase family protein [Chloroflexota bacterium]